ncbi:CBS domain-containing protein [Noviherbaspirillum massiliense]|uniref:CBS domain-containing protein n=1 Tax=Noviherbaspirillum massiliense TaxID=1465823 RepID=UPI0002DEBAB2|nr:CBS domain-containing protein [Noviherbaspirillum massiliense]
MPINECCNMTVVSCEASMPLPEVAALMRGNHVGDVIVVERKENGKIPVGIITDRDIVLGTIAVGIEANIFTAGDIMSAPIVTVREDAGLVDTLRLMRSHSIRRMPVVTDAGTLMAIVTADDIINLLAMELSLMTGAIVEQPINESQRRKS